MMKLATTIAASIMSLVGFAESALAETNMNEKELHCMALNLYHEARGEGIEGQMAVAWVTRNRVLSKFYPNTVCGVVYQRKQFSWTLIKGKSVHEAGAYEKARAIAIDVLQLPIVYDNTGGADHYHASWMKKYPGWSDRSKHTKTIGKHKFYKLH